MSLTQKDICTHIIIKDILWVIIIKHKVAPILILNKIHSTSKGRNFGRFNNYEELTRFYLDLFIIICGFTHQGAKKSCLIIPPPLINFTVSPYHILKLIRRHPLFHNSPNLAHYDYKNSITSFA